MRLPIYYFDYGMIAIITYFRLKFSSSVPETGFTQVPRYDTLLVQKDV